MNFQYHDGFYFHCNCFPWMSHSTIKWPFESILHYHPHMLMNYRTHRLVWAVFHTCPGYTLTLSCCHWTAADPLQTQSRSWLDRFHNDWEIAENMMILKERKKVICITAGLKDDNVCKLPVYCYCTTLKVKSWLLYCIHTIMITTWLKKD